MKNLNIHTYDLGKFKLAKYLLLLITVFCLSSCEKTDIEANSFSNKTHSISKDKLKIQFGQAFAKVLAEDKSARDIIKAEALKKIDYDYDVLYILIKDQKCQNGKTIEELLLQYIPDDSLSIIKKDLPNLTIFVPELPDNEFSAEIWNTFNMIPQVAIRLESSNNIPIYDKSKNKRILMPNEIPLFPVIVIKENERITVNNSPNTRGKSDSMQINSMLSFIDPSFNNMSMKKETRNSEEMHISNSFGRPTRPRRTQMDPRFIKLKEAYKLDPTCTGWQRDYVYYNISSANPNGPFQYHYKEFLWGFEMTGDILGAIQKISDQTGDPEFTGNVLGTSNGVIRVAGDGWADGEFEFKVKVYVASQTAVGNEFITYFRIKGKDLFDVTGSREGNVYKIYSGHNKTFLFPEPLPLFSWNLEEYSSTIKIAIEEVDATETITQTNSTTSEFAANFGFDKTLGETLKLGAKFGASSKVSKTVTYQISTTKGNDELGEVIINFGDKVLTDTTTMGSPINSNYHYLNLSSQYYTGWYRLYIAPGSIN